MGDCYGFDREDEICDIAIKPPQYAKGIDTFERADRNLTPEANLGICVFMIDKYIWRDKGSDLDDFKKARDYLDRAINIMEKK